MATECCGSSRWVCAARRGFTLIELLVVIAIIALLIGILLPALGEARRAGKKRLCEVNTKQYAAALFMYANEYQDKLASYTWGPYEYNSQYSDLNNPTSWSTAAMYQAVDILRRRAGRADIPRLTDRIPHRRFTHLVLNDYMAAVLPDPSMACPEDITLNDWQSHPTEDWRFPPGSAAFHKFWPYGSTYQVVPATFAEDQIQSNRRTTEQYGGDHNLFYMGELPLGRRMNHEVTFPSSKVAVFEFYDYHQGKFGLFYAHENAKSSQAYFDGSVRSVRTSETNIGFRPNRPTQPAATFMRYKPSILGFEPPTISGNDFDFVLGHYRWTRGGLKGIDVGAREVDTGQL